MRLRGMREGGEGVTHSIRSVVVVFPASMCAMTPMLRISCTGSTLALVASFRTDRPDAAVVPGLEAGRSRASHALDGTMDTARAQLPALNVPATAMIVDRGGNRIEIVEGRALCGSPRECAKIRQGALQLMGGRAVVEQEIVLQIGSTDTLVTSPWYGTVRGAGERAQQADRALRTCLQCQEHRPRQPRRHRIGGLCWITSCPGW